MYRRINENLYSSIPRYGDVFSSAHEKFLLILFIMILTLFPLRAFSQNCDVGGDIPFSVRNETGRDIQVAVDGPFFRVSGCIVIPANLSECTRFYATDFGTFSPFGLWAVKASNTGILCTRLHPEEFCLELNPLNAGATRVDIVVRNSGGFTAGEIDVSGNIVKVGGNCGWGGASYLGDKPRQSGRDTDDFLFDGTAGEEITIALDANPQSGNNGGIARLGLRGGSLNEFVEGELPQEIIATLPSDSKYSVIVMQPDIPRSERYEGNYFLTLESPTSNIGPVEPDKNVER